MNRSVNWLVASLLLCMISVDADAVEETTRWEERFAVNAGARLSVRNVWGPINITRGSAGVILVRAVETRSAPDASRFERSKSILYVHLESNENSIKLAIGDQDPNQRWRRDNPCRGCKLEIHYDVEVPADTLVSASAVNDGGIRIEQVTGPIYAKNINGPISLTDLHACTEVHNINGKVTLSFASTPDLPCEIETINGDIDIGLPDGAGMDVLMELTNGNLRTSLNPEALPMEPQLRSERDGGKTSYRITQAAGVRLGPGGQPFTIRSMNGNVWINPVQ